MTNEKPEMIKMWAAVFVGNDGSWSIAGHYREDIEAIHDNWDLSQDDVWPVKRYRIDLELPKPADPEWGRVMIAAGRFEDSARRFTPTQAHDRASAKKTIENLSSTEKSWLRRILDESDPPDSSSEAP